MYRPLIAYVFVFIVSRERQISAWDPDNDQSFNCNEKCWQGLYKAKDATDTSICDDADDYSKSIFGTETNGKDTVCLRKVSDIRRLVSTVVNSTDERMVCRPVFDTMTWYRGKQSLTARGESCRRWDSIPSLNFSSADFDRHSAPSLTVTLRRESSGLSQHENHCRNPDNHKLGPWCYYGNAKKLRRDPCFHPCVDTATRMCLSKTLFPFLPMAGSPAGGTTQNQIKHNKLVDLSDILDVPDVLKHLNNLAPYTPMVSSYDRMPASKQNTMVSTRKRCHQTIDIRTKVVGPWAPVNIADHRMSSGASQHWSWVPCFSACQDQTIKCWPVSSKATKFDKPEKDKRYDYYGHKTTTKENKPCLNWMKALYKIRNEKSIGGDIGKRHGLFNELVRGDGGRIFGKNLFLKAGVDMMNSAICLDIGSMMSSVVEESQMKVRESGWPTDWRTILDTMLHRGPGCFYEDQDRNLSFASCFHACGPDLSVVDRPPNPMNKLCEYKEGLNACKKKEVSVDVTRGRLINNDSSSTSASAVPHPTAPGIFLLYPLLVALALILGPSSQILMRVLWK